MANPNQQISHIVTQEQYEANKTRIAEMKEHLRAFEIHNEVGHEGFINWQQELTRRIRDGEQAQQMLRSLQQQSSTTQTSSSSNTAGPYVTSSLPPRNQHTPITATIEEVSSTSPRPPATPYVTGGSFVNGSRTGHPNSTHVAEGASTSYGYSGAQNHSNYYRNGLYRQHETSHVPQSSRGSINRDDTTYSTLSAQPTPFSSSGSRDGHPATTPQNQSIPRSTAANSSTSAPQRSVFPVVSHPPTTSSTTNQPVAASSEAMRKAYDDIYRVLQPYEMKKIETCLFQVFAYRTKNLRSTGMIQGILDRLQYFSFEDMRTILSSVYENLKRTVGPHNTSSYQVASTQAASTLPSQPAIQPPLEPIAQHPTLQDSIKAASTTPSQPAVQPPQAPSAQHSTLQDNTLKPSDQASVPVPTVEEASAVPPLRMEPEISKKIKEILKRLQKEHKSTKQVGEFVVVLYRATYARKIPEDALVRWAVESLQRIPVPTVQKALELIMKQLGVSNPLAGTANDAMDPVASGTTQPFVYLNKGSSSSSLTGAVDVPIAKTFAQVANASASRLSPTQLPSATGYLAKSDISISRSTTSQASPGPLNPSGRIASSSITQAAPNSDLAPTQTPTSPHSLNTSASAPPAPAPVNELPSAISDKPVSSAASGTSLGVTAQVDRSRLAEGILNELGMPTSTMSALMTKKEARRERKQEEKKRKKELESVASNASAGETREMPRESTQAIGEAQSTAGDSIQETSTKEMLHSSSLDVVPRTEPVCSVDPARLLQSEPSAQAAAATLPTEPKSVDHITTDDLWTPTVPYVIPITPHTPASAKVPTQAHSVSPAPPAEPLFLVSDSESESIMNVDYPIEESVPPKQNAVTELENRIILGSHTVASAKPRFLVNNLGKDNKNSSSQTEVRLDVGNSEKDILKRSRFYIEVPPLPIWAKMKRNEERTEEEIDDEMARVRDAEEQKALDEAFSRLKSRPCRWRGCGVVLNCTSVLCKHLTLHIHELEGIQGFKCYWRDCARRFRSSASLEHHVLRSHAMKPIFCAYKGCKDTFEKSGDLFNHNLMKHRNDSLKSSASPTTYNRAPPAQTLPDAAPSYTMVPVSQTPISADRHAKLGPWVLRQIYAPVSTKALRYNAAIPLRSSRQPDKSKNADDRSEQKSALSEIRCLRPDQYDFLPSKTFDLNKPFDNLPNETVSQDIVDGLILLWETRKEQEGKGMEQFGNDDEAMTDDELLLRAVVDDVGS